MTRMVVFDLDETLWSVSEGYCALMRPPFRLSGRDVVVDATGRRVTLRPDARATLDALAARGVLVSVASRSTPETGGAILRRLGLFDRLLCPCCAWQDKDRSLARIVDDVRASRGLVLEPPELLLVDDWPSNVRDAVAFGARGLVFGRDVARLGDVLDHLEPGADCHAVRPV